MASRRQKDPVADCAELLIAREECRHDGLQPIRFQILPHALGMSARENDAVEGFRADIIIGNRVPELLRFPHLFIRRPAIVVRSHQRRENPKPLTGNHPRISTRDVATGRGEHHVMASLAQSTPRNSRFCRIKVDVWDGDKDVSHAGSAKETRRRPEASSGGRAGMLLSSRLGPRIS